MLLKQENDISSVSYELCVLMGRDRFKDIYPADILELSFIPYSREELLETAIDNNPLWKEIELTRKQQELQIMIQESARMPKVSAQVWMGYEFGLESFHLLTIAGILPVFQLPCRYLTGD